MHLSFLTGVDDPGMAKDLGLFKGGSDGMDDI